ncbi:MAG: lysophospholipid acyltransferase family protein [Myxococcota bacterium]
MRRVLDWIFTVPFLLAFGTILLVFDPLQRLARLFGRRPQEIVAGWLQVALVGAIRLTGARVRIERSPALVEGGSYLFIGNHQSMFDIPIHGAVLWSHFPKYVSKAELARWIPSISYNLRAGGHAIIDRSDRGQATDAIRSLGRQVLERGVSAMIYPEGTRARAGALGRFRPAGARALFEEAPEVPIVPVVIDESWRLLQNNLLPVPFGTQIRIRVGDPIPRRPDEDLSAVLAECRRQMEKTLEGWRA